jgi:hypothetical protein
MASPHHHSERGLELRAILLWIIVLAGLLYGVINTFTKVIDLFAG